MKNFGIVFSVLVLWQFPITAMQDKNDKFKALFGERNSQTCLLATVLIESGIARTQSKEEIILCSQKPTIITDYVRITEPIEKGWKGYKMIGYEFNPMQSSQRLTDSDEIAPLYELMDESIHLDLNNKKTSTED